MFAVTDRQSQIGELEALAEHLESLSSGSTISSIEGDRFQELDRDLGRLSRIIRSYLIPRIRQPAMPLLVVLVGPTGSGKSTLVNTLSGLDVSRTGPLRPTTRGPVVLTSAPYQETYRSIAGLEVDVVVGEAPVLAHLAFVDTPDIDSTSTEHRLMTERLMDVADMIVFVTSALRYSDLTPWQVLRRAVSRGTPVINVLNRVPPQASGAYADYRRLLAAEGLGDDLIRIPEQRAGFTRDRIPSVAVRGLARRLMRLALDKEAYEREVLARAFEFTIDRLSELADLLVTRHEHRLSLERDIRQAFEEAWRDLAVAEIVGWMESASRVDRQSPVSPDEMRSRIGAEVIMKIQHDIRRLCEQFEIGDLIDPSRVVAVLRPAIFEAVEGWAGATRANTAEGLALLTARLEVVYAQAAETFLRAVSDPGESGRTMKELVARVFARSAFTDA